MRPNQRKPKSNKRRRAANRRLNRQGLVAAQQLARLADAPTGKFRYGEVLYRMLRVVAGYRRVPFIPINKKDWSAKARLRNERIYFRLYPRIYPLTSTLHSPVTLRNIAAIKVTRGDAEKDPFWGTDRTKLPQLLSKPK